METLQATILSGSQMSILLIGLGVGFCYAAWFRRDRGALQFLWLMWVALGLGLQSALDLQHDLKHVIYDWTPWNFALLALVPAVRLRSAGAAAMVALICLQLVAPLFMPVDEWNAAPGMNERLFGGLAGWIGFESALPLLMIIAAIAFFVRWQISENIIDLAGMVNVTLLMWGLMRPEQLTLTVAIAGGVLMAAVLFSSHRIAFFDALTGIRNRRSLDSALLSLPKRYAIGMLVVDHFKRINDRFGHDFGDQVLKAVATRAKGVRGFRFFRYGGEEFCMLFTGGQVEKAKGICEDVRHIIGDQPIAMRSISRPSHKPISKNRYREKVPGVKVTVSIGLARSGEKYDTPEAVREAADKALYRAKKNGRNRVAVAR